MKKKITVSVAMICILIIGTCSTAFATTDDGIVPPRHISNYVTASAELSISNTTATCRGTVKGTAGKTTKTSIHLYLQRYANGVWTDIDDWISEGYTVDRRITKTKTVSKGYQYRTKIDCSIYVGSKCEKVTKYSDLKSC